MLKILKLNEQFIWFVMNISFYTNMNILLMLFSITVYVICPFIYSKFLYDISYLISCISTFTSLCKNSFVFENNINISTDFLK